MPPLPRDLVGAHIASIIPRKQQPDPVFRQGLRQRRQQGNVPQAVIRLQMVFQNRLGGCVVDLLVDVDHTGFAVDVTVRQRQRFTPAASGVKQ